MNIVAAHNWTPAAWDSARPTGPDRPRRAMSTGRAIRERAVVHVADVELDREYGTPEMSRAVGFRSVLAVPMLRDGVPLGVLAVGRAEPGPFSDSQIALLQTFADQAVIAIETVRLFKELQQKNQSLTQAHAQVTESLERQTATSEILKVISRSPSDLQPVFDMIADSAARLCDGIDVTIFRVDSDVLRVVAHQGSIPAFYVGQARPIARGTPSSRAVLDRRTIHVAD